MGADDTRERILDAAARLLDAGGVEAVSTRAVSAAAGVHAPAIYRAFGDMGGLLDAVAARILESYLEDKLAMPRSGDPVEDLRRGFHLHAGLGLAHPAVYVLTYGSGRGAGASEAQRRGAAVLEELVRAIAAAGLLAMPVPDAASLAHAAGRGTVLELIGRPRDAEADAAALERAFAMVLGAILVDGEASDGGAVAAAPAPGAAEGSARAAAARTLAASLDDVAVLSAAERALLGEWLERLACPSGTATSPAP